MGSISESKSVNLGPANHPLTAEEQAEQEKNLAISEIARDLHARALQDKIFKAPEYLQHCLFVYMSTESLIALSKITNPDTHSPERIVQSVRGFAVNEFNKKFNKGALLAGNAAVLLKVKDEALTADILLSIELKDIEEELALHIIYYKDSQFVDAEATEGHLKNLQAEERKQLLRNPNTYKYSFIVHFFRIHFKEEYEAKLQHIYNNYIENLSSLNDVFKKSKDFMLIAVSQDGLSLEYADEELKKDWQIVLAAVQQNGMALQYADEELKRDQKIVLAAVQQSGWALQYADEEFKQDQKIFLAAVQHNGFALQYAGEELKRDPKIVLAAVQYDGFALRYAHKDLRNDPKFMEEVQKIERNRRNN